MIKTLTELRGYISNKINLERGIEGVAKRIISKNNFILKGGGWEKDGYSRNK